MSMYRTVTITPRIIGNPHIEVCLHPNIIELLPNVITAITTYQTDAPVYTGEYEVNPSFTEKILETQNKLMTDNVTVNGIQIEQVSNTSGGLTVYIGGI